MNGQNGINVFSTPNFRRNLMYRVYRSLILFCSLILLIACSDSSDNATVAPPYAQTIAETQAFITSLMDERNIVGLSIALIDAEMKNSSKLLGSGVWSGGQGNRQRSLGRIHLLHRFHIQNHYCGVPPETDGCRKNRSGPTHSELHSRLFATNPLSRYRPEQPDHAANAAGHARQCARRSV